MTRSCIIIMAVMLTLVLSLLAVNAQLSFSDNINGGSQEVTGVLGTGSNTTYTITLLPFNQWARIAINVSTSDNVTAIIQRRQRSGLRSLPFVNNGASLVMVMKPSTTGDWCPTIWECTYTIIITSKKSLPFGMLVDCGAMLEYNVPISDSIMRATSRYYAIDVVASDLNVLIDMIPTGSQWDDIDISIFMESLPFTNLYGGNPGGNAEEYALITTSEYERGLYIIGLFAYIDPDVPANFTDFAYTLSVTPNYDSPSYFGLSMFGVVGALTIFVLCLFFAAAVIARRRRQADIHIQIHGGIAMAARASPPPEVGAPKSVIDKLPKRVYVMGSLSGEDARCTICLCDYDGDDMLRDLKCGHSFHQPCIDQWLTVKRHCPLCQQDVERAANAHRVITVNEPSMGSRTLAIGVPGQVHDHDDSAQQKQQQVEHGSASGSVNGASSDAIVTLHVNATTPTAATATATPAADEPAMIASYSPQITPTAASASAASAAARDNGSDASAHSSSFVVV